MVMVGHFLTLQEGHLTKLKKLDSVQFTKTVLGKENIFKKQWKISLGNYIKKVPDFANVWRKLGKY